MDSPLFGKENNYLIDLCGIVIKAEKSSWEIHDITSGTVPY
jgi:hypothetical protein